MGECRLKGNGKSLLPWGIEAIHFSKRALLGGAQLVTAMRRVRYPIDGIGMELRWPLKQPDLTTGC